LYEVEVRLSKPDDNTYNLWCYLKGTDTRVESEQLREWFDNDLVLGVSVKRAPRWMGVNLDGRPGFGKITAIRDGVIVLDDDEEIPSPLFHEWYTLD
jgi:hypothetical protein